MVGSVAVDPIIWGWHPSECHQLIQIPLWHSLNGTATVLPQPGIDMLGGGGAPLVSGADPPFARHQGSDRGHVGEQDAGPVCQLNLSLVAADLLDDHGVRLN